MALGSLYAGTSGGVNAVAIAVNPLSDTVNFVGVPTQQVEFKEWRVSIRKTGSSAVYTFNGPVNAQGIVFPEPVRGGTGSWTVNLTAVITDNLAAYVVGTFLLVDLLFFKGLNKGYPNVPCVISNISPGSNVEQAGAMQVQMELECFGVPTLVM